MAGCNRWNPHERDLLWRYCLFVSGAGWRNAEEIQEQPLQIGTEKTWKCEVKA